MATRREGGVDTGGRRVGRQRGVKEATAWREEDVMEEAAPEEVKVDRLPPRCCPVAASAVRSSPWIRRSLPCFRLWREEGKGIG
jgi:hypothetical protein